MEASPRKRDTYDGYSSFEQRTNSPSRNLAFFGFSATSPRATNLPDCPSHRDSARTRKPTLPPRKSGELPSRAAERQPQPYGYQPPPRFARLDVGGGPCGVSCRAFL